MTCQIGRHFTAPKILATGECPSSVKVQKFVESLQCLNNIQFIPSGISVTVTKRKENYVKWRTGFMQWTAVIFVCAHSMETPYFY
jgi:hypothetical protein